MNYWDERGFGRFAVTDKRDGEFIGYSGLGVYDNRVELNYGLSKQHWGKGYATEAALACLRYGFEELKLDRIAAVARVENIASQRVAENIGMEYEGELSRLGFDFSSYVIVREEFEPGTALYVVHKIRS
jgi:ribosomal-protein-alanine N-acetyltransferase